MGAVMRCRCGVQLLINWRSTTDKAGQLVEVAGDVGNIA